MPTFNDAHADAREAAEAVRGLAHATQHVENPDVLYPVVGELMATTRRLSQVLDQLARAHQQHLPRAVTDDGDREIGGRYAVEAATALQEAAALVDRADTVLDRASNRAGRIAWQPEDIQHKWVSVVFLQGGEAEPVLDIIDQQGTDAAIEYLAGWDHGQDTVDSAMEYGYVYDTAPRTPADVVATRGDYAISYSHGLGYVGVARRIPVPDPALWRTDAPAVEATTAALSREGAGRHRSRERRDGASWFRPDAIDEVAENRGLFR
ncbi:hypothetical protein [Streptomonospora nanhaiensis]|uniref:hypothetical protein n=1 Tax=Streptomonospora nanhaiensis TaxID=1323731 RepID=UPI001C383487|nr:hypothetical protein [Streptomonospora nanhaiensis]MBV2363520.1 hypothetical protein [Streptomonospora nanhaiensis]